LSTLRSTVLERARDPASHPQAFDTKAAFARARTYPGFVSGLDAEARRRLFSHTGVEVAGKPDMAGR